MLNLKQEGKTTTIEAVGFNHDILTEFDVLSIKFYKTLKEKKNYTDGFMSELIMMHCTHLLNYFC